MSGGDGEGQDGDWGRAEEGGGGNNICMRKMPHSKNKKERQIQFNIFSDFTRQLC